jgi:hypothetical protein
MRQNSLQTGALIGLALIFGLSAGAQGSTVYGDLLTNAQRTGESRTAAAGELVVVSDAFGSGPPGGHPGKGGPPSGSNDPWLDSAEIAWDITDNGDGTLHYKYTFTGFGDPEVSHMTLDLSDNAFTNGQPEDGVVTNAKINGSSIGPLSNDDFGDISVLPGSNPNRDDYRIDSAVKFDVGSESESVVYEFDSNREPVWGDILVKGGRGFLHNAGLTSLATANGTPLSDSVNDFIARPDTNVVTPPPNDVTPVPTPSAYAGGLILLAGLATAAVRRRLGLRS